jgi:hypothetical protein
MSNARLRLAFAGETRFPLAFVRREFVGANSRLATNEGAPFFSRAWRPCRFLGEPPGSPKPPPLIRFADKALRAFPTPLPAHRRPEGL